MSLKKADGLNRYLDFKIPAQQIKQEMEERLRVTAIKAKVQGFRVGKVPMAIIEKMYGAQIHEEVVEVLASQLLSGLLEKEKIITVAPPYLKSREDKKDGTVCMVIGFEVYPKISTTSYRKIKLKKPIAPVSDSDVRDYIALMRKQRQQNIANTTETSAVDSNEIDSKNNQDNNDYADFGVQKDKEEEFLKAVRDHLEERVQRDVRESMCKDLFEELLTQHRKFLLPNALITRAVKRSLEEANNPNPNSNPNDNQVKSPDLSDEQKKEVEDGARRQVRLGLVLRNLIDELDIKVDPKRVRSTIEEYASAYPNRDEVIAAYYANDKTLQSIESKVIEEQLMDALFTKIKIKEVASDCKTLLGLNATTG